MDPALYWDPTRMYLEGLSSLTEPVKRDLPEDNWEPVIERRVVR
jgi:hypothetical protein